MIPSVTQFNQLTQNEKIKFIQQHAPHLLNLLKKSLSSLSSQELGNLFEFANFEAAAKAITESFTKDLTNYLTSFSSIIEPVIKELNLSNSEKSLLDNIFKKTLIFAISRASSGLYTNFKEGEGLLYGAILSEKTVTTLEGILDFKKAIDKNFPGLSDVLISSAAPALLSLVSIYSPPLGLALKATGVLSKVTDFLKTDNLDKTITNMYHSLEKIKQDKTLSEIHETGTKLADIAKQIGVSPLINDLEEIKSRIEKFNFTLETASETVQEISKNASSKKFLMVLADYAQTYIPSSSIEINAQLEGVKKATLSELEKNGVPKELIAEVSQVLDHSIKEAKSEMKKCFDKDTKIIDKVGHILIAADILSKAESHVAAIGQKNPSHSKAFKECREKLKVEVNSKVRGDVSKIANEMKADSPAKTFAKKTLGVTLANEILIKRSAPEKNLGKSSLHM